MPIGKLRRTALPQGYNLTRPGRRGFEFIQLTLYVPQLPRQLIDTRIIRPGG